MKVTIKSLNSNKKFLDLVKYINSINLDIFRIDSEDNSVCFDYDKLIIKNIEQQNQSNYQNYLFALDKLDDLYCDYNSQYPTIIEFVNEMYTCLKNEISKKYILKSDNSLPQKQLTEQRLNYYESKRKEYLGILRFHSSTDLSVLLIESQLKEQKIENLIHFIDLVEEKVSKLVDKNDSSQNARANALDFILFRSLEESTIKEGNNLISQKININKNKLQNNILSLNTCGFLLNYINLYEKNMLAQNIGFDGFYFFDLTTGDRITNTSYQLHKDNLSFVERNLQSNFVLNENFAKAILNFPKKHMHIRRKKSLIYTEVDQGENYKVIKTLFQPGYPRNTKANLILSYALNLGYFVKVKRINQNNGSYEIMLYYYCDKDLRNGIQLLRTDKVENIFKGNPASHILRGGEKIFTLLHIHEYNLIDACIKNNSKESSLGNMDIAYNYLNPDKISMNVAEEMFNQKCSIEHVGFKNKCEKEI